MVKITDLSRIDRAIAENLSDIKTSFEDYAGIVQDFIVFITEQMKFDLFGYTKFTLKDFCNSSGRNRQDLAVRHPLFTQHLKKPPEVDGFRFETIFDYALIVMMQRNLVFRQTYRTKEHGQIINLESIRILSDVRLNVNRKSKEVKIYEVKVSPELLEGFIKRYYMLDTKAYRIAGKGKGGDNRKALLIYLSMIRHRLLSQNENTAIFPLELLCEQADIRSSKSFHRKDTLRKILTSLRDKAGFPFEFDFVSSSGYGYEYHVKLVFGRIVNVEQLQTEHAFYYALIDDLKRFFDSHYRGRKIDVKEPFQVWLTRPEMDGREKMEILKKVYYKFFNTNLSDSQAFQFIKFGFNNH